MFSLFFLFSATLLPALPLTPNHAAMAYHINKMFQLPRKKREKERKLAKRGNRKIVFEVLSLFLSFSPLKTMGLENWKRKERKRERKGGKKK